MSLRIRSKNNWLSILICCVAVLLVSGVYSPVFPQPQQPDTIERRESPAALRPSAIRPRKRESQNPESNSATSSGGTTSENVYLSHSYKLAPASAISFGASVSIDGNTAVVGAPNGGTSGSGIVYIYKRVNSGWTSTWSLDTTIEAASTPSGFGYSVAVRGDVLVVGAPYENQLVGMTTYNNQGAVYVFERSGGVWNTTAAASFTSPVDMSYDDSGTYNLFGNAVSTDGSSIAVGAPGSRGNAGSAYVYTKTGASWSSNSLGLREVNSSAGDFLGSAVAVDGNYVMFGWPGASPNGFTGGGTISFYYLTTGTWTYFVNVNAGGAGRAVGTSVAVTAGGIFAYGATQPGIGQGYINKGTLVGTSLTLLGSIGAPFADSVLQRFGASIALNSSGNKLMVGAPDKTVGSTGGQGEIYLYEDPGSGWVYSSRTTSSLGGTPGSFGSKIGLSGSTVLVSAPLFPIAQLHSPSGAPDGAVFFLEDYTTTSAGARISGRIFTPTGAGLRGAVATLTDSRGFVRRFTAGTLGYFKFDDIVAGETYILGVESRRFKFQQKVINLTEDLTGIEMRATK